MKTQQEKANDLIRQGNEFHRQKKYAQAIMAYQHAIKLVPAYGSLHTIVGDMYFEQKLYAEAIQSYQLTNDYIPEHEQAWDKLGQCLMLLGRHEEAEAALDKAITFHPNDALSLYYGAVVSKLQENPKKAARYLQRALNKRPDWETRAQEDPTLQSLFSDGLINQKPWWQFWKKKS